LIWSDGNCEDVVTITVGDNCDCPSGDNQITAPALTEICFEFPATQILGNDASPAGGSYEWQINANNTGFVSAGGINNTKDYTTEALPVGNYIIRRVYTVVANGQDCIYESNPVTLTFIRILLPPFPVTKQFAREKVQLSLQWRSRLPLELRSEHTKYYVVYCFNSYCYRNRCQRMYSDL
jgi:hypothetical protein